MQLQLVGQFLLLLAVANGMPIAAKNLLGDRLGWPLDCGLPFVDGRPLFGRSKTWRGLLVSLASSTAAAPLLALAWEVGLVAGGGAMLGDLLSSFVKRRLDLVPSSRATGLDQIPESLLPALACQPWLGLSMADVALIVALFFVGEIVLSRLLYQAHLRDRPY